MKKRKLLVVLGVGLLSLSSCTQPSVEPEPEPEEERIPEDTTTLNVIEDNYRNYYQILVGTFANGDGSSDKMGDLKGVKAKLDYIKDTGFNGLWMLPVFTSPSYHKYDASNYYEIDPQYGTMQDLQDLLTTAHTKNIKVILDLVLNHCATNNPLYTNWLTQVQRKVRGETLSDEEDKIAESFSYETYSGSESVRSGYHQVAEAGGKKIAVECRFTSSMPEFNFDSEYVRQYFKDVIKYYVDMGVDGFRCDAVRYLYYGNPEKNYEALSYFASYAKSLKADTYFVGENWETNASTKGYYKNTTFDSYFNFDACGPNSGSICYTLGTTAGFPDLFLDLAENNIDLACGHIPAPFLDNHDMNRVALSSKDAFKINKARMGLLQILNGSTFTYYGDELGMTNTPSYGDPGRRVHFPWSKTEKTYNCKDPTGASSKNCYPAGYLDEQMADENSIYNYTKKALLLRNQNPEIARGEILDSSDAITVYDDNDEEVLQNYLLMDKSYNNSTIRIVYNFSDKYDLEYTYKDTSYTSVVGQLCATDDTYITRIDESTIRIPPLGMAILK